MAGFSSWVLSAAGCGSLKGPPVGSSLRLLSQGEERTTGVSKVNPVDQEPGWKEPRSTAMPLGGNRPT